MEDEAGFSLRLADGDPEAWRDFLARYGGLVAGACRRALQEARQPAGEEAVADAAAEVVRHLLEEDARLLRRHRPGTPLGAYLRVVARTRTLNAVRRTLPLREFLPAQPPDPVAETAAASERAWRVRQALEGLEPRDAQALRLFHMEGLTYAQIAVRTGLPEAQMGMILARARQRLREALGKDFEETL